MAAFNGFARLVVPGDIAGGRYVSNISEMSVFDGVAGAYPSPSTWAMMLLGFLGVGLTAYRGSSAGRRSRSSDNFIITERTPGGLVRPDCSWNSVWRIVR